MVDVQNDNLLYSEYTSFNRRVKEQRSDQYRYSHQADGSVDETPDVIDANDQLVKTETPHINSNGAYQKISTFNYATSKNGEVNVTKTNHGDGSTEQYKYQTD